MLQYTLSIVYMTVGVINISYDYDITGFFPFLGSIKPSVEPVNRLNTAHLFSVICLDSRVVNLRY